MFFEGCVQVLNSPSNVRGATAPGLNLIKVIDDVHGLGFSLEGHPSAP